MKICVVYALPGRQIVRDLDLAESATVNAALQASGLLQEFPAIREAVTSVGIYGRIAAGDDVLQPGDRVEIYRPLSMEPGAARRQRSKKR